MDFVSQTRNFSFWFLSTAHVLVVLRLQRAIRVVCIKGHGSLFQLPAVFPAILPTYSRSRAIIQHVQSNQV